MRCLGKTGLFAAGCLAGIFSKKEKEQSEVNGRSKVKVLSKVVVEEKGTPFPANIKSTEELMEILRDKKTGNVRAKRTYEIKDVIKSESVKGDDRRFVYDSRTVSTTEGLLRDIFSEHNMPKTGEFATVSSYLNKEIVDDIHETNLKEDDGVLKAIKQVVDDNQLEDAPEDDLGNRITN